MFPISHSCYKKHSKSYYLYQIRYNSSRFSQPPLTKKAERERITSKAMDGTAPGQLENQLRIWNDNIRIAVNNLRAFNTCDEAPLIEEYLRLKLLAGNLQLKGNDLENYFAIEENLENKFGYGGSGEGYKYVIDEYVKAQERIRQTESD